MQGSFTEDDDRNLGKDILSQENINPDERIPCQLPKKEDSSESFVVPCTIGNFDLFALADLGSSINIMPLSLFLSLKLTSLMKTSLIVKMADTTKTSPIGIVDNVILKINKFLFPADL